MSGVTISDDAADDYDPLAVFQSMAAGPSSQELYGKFADLRAEGPVHLETPEDADGAEGGRDCRDGRREADRGDPVTAVGSGPEVHDGELRGGSARSWATRRCPRAGYYERVSRRLRPLDDRDGRARAQGVPEPHRPSFHSQGDG